MLVACLPRCLPQNRPLTRLKRDTCSRGERVVELTCAIVPRYGRRVVILDRWTGAAVAIEPYESIAQAFARKSEIDDGPSQSQASVTALDEKTLVAVGRRAIAIEARTLEKRAELDRPPPAV